MDNFVAQVHQDKDGDSATSECSWYFVIFSVDSTLGVALVLTAHELCVKMARARISGAQNDHQQHDGAAGRDLEVLNSNIDRSPQRRISVCGEPSEEYQWVCEYIAECGEYGDPPDVYKWAVQVCNAYTPMAHRF